MMNVLRACVIAPFLFLGPPAHAQHPCEDCLTAAQGQLKQCLESAISAEDKKSCLERQEAKSKTCETGACKMERDRSTK
ncbi:MAG: hypothetical protein ABIR36_10740, partial [Nitrospiraceae bacterium]